MDLYIIFNLSRDVNMATKQCCRNEDKLILRAFFAHSPDGRTVSFCYYLLGGDTAAQSEQLARLCQAFLVGTEMWHLLLLVRTFLS